MIFIYGHNAFTPAALARTCDFKQAIATVYHSALVVMKTAWHIKFEQLNTDNSFVHKEIPTPK
jgi:hypothetical protein